MKKLGIAVSVVAFLTGVSVYAGRHQVCDQPKLRQCREGCAAIINDVKGRRVPQLENRKAELPSIIQRCWSEKSSIDIELGDLNVRFGATQGRLEANQASVVIFSKVLSTLTEKRSLFTEMRTLIEYSVPQLIQELRIYLAASEIALEVHISDLLDEIDRAKSPEEKKRLEFSLLAMNDLKAIRETAGSVEKIYEMISSGLDTSRGQESLKLFSPMTRTLLDAARGAFVSYVSGAQAFAELERSWGEMEAQVRIYQEQALVAIQMEYEAEGFLAEARSVQARASESKASECHRFQQEFNQEVDAAIRAAWDEHNRADHDWNHRCPDTHCWWEEDLGGSGRGKN